MLKKILPIFLITFLINFSACTINVGQEKDVINGLYEKKVLTSNVTINTYIYLDTLYSQGSGVIFKKDDQNYYVLTNNHVLFGSNNYSIVDGYGEDFRARLIYNDSNYDLAILQFTSSENYFVPEILDKDPKENTPIISIGSPNGLINTVTLGKVEKYEKIEALDSETNLSAVGNDVSFAVLAHDARVDGGSSGGAIFSYDYKICGINFASGIDGDKAFVSGYAIQPTKILEFLANASIEP